jgi:hypothetical protein
MMLWIGGLECVAGKAHTAQVRLGIPIFNSTLSALHNVWVYVVVLMQHTPC